MRLLSAAFCQLLSCCPANICLTGRQHALDEVVHIAEDEAVSIDAISCRLLALQRLDLQALHHECLLLSCIVEYRPVCFALATNCNYLSKTYLRHPLVIARSARPAIFAFLREFSGVAKVCVGVLANIGLDASKTCTA